MRVAVAPERIVPEDVATVELESERGPMVTVTVGRVLVTALPPIVALIVVAVPDVVPVKVAV